MFKLISVKGKSEQSFLICWTREVKFYAVRSGGIQLPRFPNSTLVFYSIISSIKTKTRYGTLQSIVAQQA